MSDVTDISALKSGQKFCSVCHVNVYVGPEKGCSASHKNVCVGPEKRRSRELAAVGRRLKE
jgi:hypothetical protein